MNNKETENTSEELSHRETFSIIINAVAAGLFVGGIFIIAFVIFVLFCTNVWFL